MANAAIRGVHGSERILVKLNRMIAGGEYYEAHQLYRTLYFRYSNSNKYSELRHLLFDGSILFLVNGQHNSGADLAGLYLNAVSDDPTLRDVLGDDQLQTQISKDIGDLFKQLPAKSPERMQFTISALKLDPSVFNISLLHKQFALVLWKEKNYPEARYHFLHSPANSGEECALMLIEYHISSGYHAEVDLFIAQFILQLLCRSTSARAPTQAVKKEPADIEDLDQLEAKTPQQALANKTLQSYTIKHPRISKKKPPFGQPLLNFLWFLLLAVDSGKLATFRALCELYAASLARDPNYKQYLAKIGELYFGVKAPPKRSGMGGIFGNLLQTLMNEDMDDSDDSPIPTPTQAVAATARTTVEDDLD